MEKFLAGPHPLVSRGERETRQGHRGAVFWFTGLSGSGKSTLAQLVEKELFAIGINIIVLDGDIIRHGLCAGLGFGLDDRTESIRRVAEISKILAERGFVCVCSFITPLKEHRELARHIVGEDYNEIYVSCPLEICEQRDVKGYYKLAREGVIKDYTGITSPYDIPQQPDLCIETHLMSAKHCATQLKIYILEEIYNTTDRHEFSTLDQKE